MTHTEETIMLQEGTWGDIVEGDLLIELKQAISQMPKTGGAREAAPRL